MKKCNKRRKDSTFLCVVHPVEHDLGSSAVSRGHIACHYLGLGSSQTKIQQPDVIVCTHSNVTGLYVLLVKTIYDGRCVYVRVWCRFQFRLTLCMIPAEWTY